MLKRIQFACLAAIFSGISFATSADTLDFTEIGATGILGTTDITLSNATLTSYGNNFFVYAPGATGESNGKGSICAMQIGCRADMEISFNEKVMDLTFGVFGYAAGDAVSISAFNDGALVQSLLITSETFVDFSGFGVIDRLFFDDVATGGHGLGYNDFSFSSVSVSAVPLPAAFPLFGAAMVGLGLLGWKRKKI
ncbi:MAG: hypothetical protein MI799_06700 [Desulfobacterales bacterium]|nr:hypothetical protein [Desulfobacterales bacterium]